MRAFQTLTQAIDSKARVLFMDEAVFTSAQVSPKVWYNKQKTPVMIPRKKLSFKAIAVAAAIDMEGAVVGLEIGTFDVAVLRFDQIRASACPSA